MLWPHEPHLIQQSRQNGSPPKYFYIFDTVKHETLTTLNSLLIFHFLLSPLYTSRENELSFVSFPLCFAGQNHRTLKALDPNGEGGGKAVCVLNSKNTRNLQRI